MEINLTEYLTKEEVKEIVINEVKDQIRQFFKDEKNSMRLLSNLSYQIVFDEVDKIVPNCREMIVDKTTEVLKNSINYAVFHKSSFGSSASLATQIVEAAVKDNKEMINQKVKETITSHDYRDEIWSKFEELSETFISNIYSIVELGRKKK